MKRTGHTSIGRRLLLGILAIGITVGAATEARAQVFISPFIGYGFGGSAGCPALIDCRDKKISAGVSFGAMGNLFGLEGEVAYAPDFFGKVPFISSSVLTMMANVMLVPNMGPVRPYALAGIGLIKTHVGVTLVDVLSVDNNKLGWDVGGGLMGLVSDHVGVRGDIRYFHSFQDISVLGFTLDNTKLNYARASVGVVLRF